MIKKMLPQEFANTLNVFVARNENGEIFAYEKRPLPQTGRAFFSSWRSAIQDKPINISSLVKYPILELWETESWEDSLVCPK